MRFPAPVRTRTRTRIGAAAAVATVGVALLLGAVPAAAAPSPAGPAPAAALSLSLKGTVGMRCIDGSSAGGNTRLTVTQKRGKKVLKVASDPTGSSWRVCLKPLRIGDKLLFTKGTRKATRTVPNLRLTVDRLASTATGRVPTGNLDYEISFQDTLGDHIVSATTLNKTAAADGTFFSTTPGQFASDRTTLRWIAPSGDTWRVEAAIPGVAAEVGSAKVIVYGSVGSKRTVTLKTGAGATRATGAVTLTAPSGTVTLRKNGSAVKVQAGDKVSVSGYPEELVVRVDDLAVSDAATGGAFTGHCDPFTRYLARGFLSGSLEEVWSGNANGLGAVAVSPLVPVVVPAGFKVVLDCESSVGMVQRMIASFP